MPLFVTRQLLRFSFSLSLLILLSVSGRCRSQAETVTPPPMVEKKIGLEEAIRLALEKSYLIKVDAYTPAIARAGVTEAWGQYDPKLTGSYQESRDEKPYLVDPITGLRPVAAITKTNDANLVLEGMLPLGTTYQIGASTVNYRGSFNGYTDTYSTFTGATFTQPLLRDFGLNPGMYQIKVARTNLAISEWDYRLSVINLLTRVIYAYSDLHLAHAYLKSALRSREMAVQLYNENEGRRKRGAMSEYDVLSAHARVANREEYVIKAEQSVKIAENALKQLITDERATEFFGWQIIVEPLPPAPSVVIDAAVGFRDALANRPDYRRATLNVDKSDLDHRYQRNQILPRVDLNGGYGYNGIGPDSASSRTDARHQNYVASSAGVSVSVPLTFSTERGRTRAAKLRLRQAETDLQRLEQDILVDVSNAAQQVESTRQRVATTKTARSLNEEMLEAEVKRLRAGTGSTFSVLYQQEQLSSAEIAAAQAMADHRKALAEYDRQTGHTLEAHHVALRTE